MGKQSTSSQWLFFNSTMVFCRQKQHDTVNPRSDSYFGPSLYWYTNCTKPSEVLHLGFTQSVRVGRNQLYCSRTQTLTPCTHLMPSTLSLLSFLLHSTQGTSGDLLIQSPAQAETGTGHPGKCPARFQVTPQIENPQSFWVTCLCLTIITVKHFSCV